MNRNLIYIKSHFDKLPDSIINFETRGMCLSEWLNILEGIRVVINNRAKWSRHGNKQKKKMENAFKKIVTEWKHHRNSEQYFIV